MILGIVCVVVLLDSPTLRSRALCTITRASCAWMIDLTAPERKACQERGRKVRLAEMFSLKVSASVLVPAAKRDRYVRVQARLAIWAFSGPVERKQFASTKLYRA